MSTTSGPDLARVGPVALKYFGALPLPYPINLIGSYYIFQKYHFLSIQYQYITHEKKLSTFK